MKQTTLAKPATVTGIGVNSGAPVTLTMKPAPVGHGIVFRRTDLPERPEIRPLVAGVTDLVRKTTISANGVQVFLVEHVLSALHGCGVDNVEVEMSAAEAPIMDGSAKDFVRMIHEAGIVEQSASREFFVLDEPVVVSKGSSIAVALPSAQLQVTCTALDERAVIQAQHMTATITPEFYAKEIAAARTYVLFDDAEAMKKAGGIKGGTLDNCIVLKGAEVMVNEPLRFPDELVRHKILDVVGDIMLLGLPVKAHIIVAKAGHALHAELTKAMVPKVRRVTS